MKYIKKENSNKFQNKTMTYFEYPLEDKEISCDVVEINSRFPDVNWAVNEKCKELFFVLNGSGTLTTETESISLTKDDMVTINPQEKYFWSGNLTLLCTCTPAWSEEQSKIEK